MRWKALVLAMLVVVSGCVGTPSEDPDESQTEEDRDQDPTYRTVNRTFTYIGEVGPGTESQALPIGGEELLGAGLVGMHVDLVWGQATNTFTAKAIRPDGTEHRVTPTDQPQATRAQGDVTRLAPGAWEFVTRVEGAHLSDTVKLFVNVTWKVPEDRGNPLGGAGVPGPIHTQQHGEGWIAWQRYSANGTASDEMTADVNTTNGAISVNPGTVEVSERTEAGPGFQAQLQAQHQAQAQVQAQAQLQPQAQGESSQDQVRVVVNATARADTEQDARERVRDINVTIILGEEQIQVEAQAPDWEQRGASARIGVPANTTLDARLDTTNGAIQLSNVQTSGLVADTTNGAIDAALTGAGDVILDTTNGAITLAFTPTDASTIEADTTNGAATLTLHEASEIGYEIDADTTNGQITEDMEEASLQGSETEATLVTENYDGREIQVDGLADTTNGNIHFSNR